MKLTAISIADSPDPGHDVAESLKASGFAIISQHGIAPNVFSELFDAWGKFFADEERFDYRADPETQTGYFSPQLAETAKGSQQPDIKEYFHYRPDCRIPAQLATVTRNYFDAVFALGVKMHSWIQQHTDPALWQKLDNPLAGCLSHQQTMCRILSYPPLTGKEQVGAVRAAEHEDINFLTLLPAATTGGLEIKPRGNEWMPVVAEPGSIILNIGDMLQELTDGALPSTTHRVVNPEGADNATRMTAPVFCHPQPTLRLSPRHTAASYLAERLYEITRPELGKI